eukprot:Nitzschia sp. Nitz4//scaffold39_size137210//19237//22361//NITZ4_003186-RA/size137210-augustus-gene-0.178-mRNA-1//1//CDS//3329550344//9444//frame0
MSRSSKRNSAANNDKGSHPLEKDPAQRRFLARSLGRNDKELAALSKLNASLHKAREQIIQSCGELVLLDLGAGRFTLINDELHETKSEDKDRPDVENYSLTPAQRDLCIDFILRMKLRRRLSNRLVRRLNRVAQAMDGVDIHPPNPPRYGDLRLHLDPKAVEAHKELSERKEAAKKALTETKEQQESTAREVPKVSSAPVLKTDEKEKEPKGADSNASPQPPQQQPQATPSSKEAPASNGEVKPPPMETSAEPMQVESSAEKPPKEATPESNAEVKDRSSDEDKEAEPTQEEPKDATMEESKDDSKDATKEESKDESKDAATEEPKEENKEESKDATMEEPKEESTDEAKEAATEEPKEESKDEAKSAATEGSKEESKAKTKEDAKDETKEEVKEERKDTNGDSHQEPTEPVKSNGDVPPKEPDSVASKPPAQEEEPALQEDTSSLLQEFDMAYDKVWNEQLQNFKYVLADQTVEPDYKQIKAGAAIGATARFSTEQEREQEYIRWQTTLLSKIPQQPTFEDLGLKNRVFCLEQRRKRCLEETYEDDEEPPTKMAKHDEKIPTAQEEDTKEEKVETSTESDDEKAKDEDAQEKSEDVEMEDEDADPKKEKSDSKSEEEGDSDEHDDEDEDEEESDKQDDEDEADEGGSNESPQEEVEEPKKKIKLEPRKPQADKEEEAPPEEVVPEPKLIRPMSLAAVPSFYDQDMQRIRTVHGDLLGSSILEHSRRRMTEATREYNEAFRLSNQVFDHRNRLQQNMNFVITKARQDQARASGEHNMQVAMAKQRWMKQKQEHDLARVKQFLPSNWGRHPFGTGATQNYQRRGGLFSVIATTVADIVDGSLIVAEGKVPNNKFESFVPPPANNAMIQQHARMEQELRHQINECGVKLAQSEEARKRAWKKMMKVKAEIEPANSYGRSRVDLTNYHQIPVPPLRNSTQQALPTDFAMNTSVASYTPPVGTSDSKYSAARVRQRISSDGTVAPVTEPKKDKDGFYVRPAGRTRKGMQWDSMRGIWVPE